MTAVELASKHAEILNAFVRGERIEWKPKIGADLMWFKVSLEPVWDFYRNDYRVKPKPMEAWANVYTGSPICYHGTEEAARTNRGMMGFIRCVHLREVED